MILLLISIVFALLVTIVLYYKCKIIKPKNKVHFYVARDKDGSLFLHIGKPIRGETEFYSELYYDHVEFYCCDYSFEVFGLNKNDYANLKWEDEPLEVVVNTKD
jgi:hypothetical protein